MTLKEKIVAACVVLIFGAAIGWFAAQIPPRAEPELPGPVVAVPEPEVKVSIFDLSDAAWAKLEYVLRGGE